MITLYGSPTCGMCSCLEEMMTQKNIPFTKVDDPDVVLSKGIQSIPVVETGGIRMNFPQAMAWLQTGQLPEREV